MFKNVIIDNAQAFYSLPQKSIPTIYSPRKFFGVPDGGFAYCKYTQPQEFPNDESYNRSIHLLARRDNGAEFGYPFFQTNEDIHKGLPIRKMSNLTTQLLRNIDFKKVCAFRNRNFNYLHQKLGSINQFTSLISIKQINGPLAYPFIRKGNSTLKIELIKNKIFVPTYWPNMENRPIKCNTIEWDLYTNLLALPIDQRIGQLELNYIIENIKQTK